MLVYAGEASAHFNFFEDVWLYGLLSQSWTQLALPASGPSSRAGHSSVWDEADEELLIFGGQYGTDVYGDLWILSLRNSTWTRSNAASPQGRAGHSATWQPFQRAMLVFAGQGSFLLNDLWMYRAEAQTWKQLHSSGGPAPRSRHSAVWDQATEAMLVFGGWAFFFPLDVKHIQYDLNL